MNTTTALINALEGHFDALRTATAGMESATARMGQTLVRARRLAGDARALLEEATD